MNRTVLFLIVLGVGTVAFLVWFLQDVEPVKSYLELAKPYFANAIQFLKDNIGATLTAVFGSSGAIVLLLKSKMNSVTSQIAGQANQKVGEISQQLNDAVAEKLKLTSKVEELTGTNTNLQNQLTNITSQVGDSTKQLLDSQNLLATANKRIEDIVKDNETLRKALEFNKANEDGAYVK